MEHRNSIYAKGLLFIAILLTSLYTFSQIPFYRQFNISDKLPSSRVFKCLEDNNGFLWFATDAGISVFDGHNFKTYTAENGFTDYGAFHMLLDSKNRLWFFTFTGSSCYYKDGEFHPFNLVHNGDTLGITWIDESSNGDLWFATHNGYLAHLSQNLKVNWIKNIYPNHKITALWCINDSLTLAWDVNFKFYIDNNKVEKIADHSDIIYHAKLLKLRDGRIIYTNLNGINLLENRKLKLVLPFKKGFLTQTVTCLYQDKEGNLWVGNEEGAFCFKNSILDYNYCKKYFNNISILSILNDREGNYWFTTNLNGVFMVPDLEAEVIPVRNTEPANPFNIKYIKKIGESIVCFDDSLNSFKIEKGKFIRTHLPNIGSININYKKSQGVWLMNANNFYFYSATDTLSFSKFGELDYGTLLIHDSVTIICLLNNIYKKSFLYKTDTLINNNTYPIKYSKVCIEDENGNIWFSSISGLFLYNGKEVIDLGKTNKAFKSYITEMEADLSGNIWMVSKGDGIFCIKNGKLYKQLNSKNSIIPNNCNAIHVDEDNNVWIGTNYGLYKISQENVIMAYSAFNTLPAPEVTDVCIVGDKVYAVTPKGIAVFNKTKLPAYTIHPPNTFITGFAINSRDTTLRGNYSLNHIQNNIKISYTGISYSGGEDLLYQYKLESVDSSWHTTTHDVIEFSSLNPGQYALRVRSFVAGQMPGRGAEAVISFEIKPAFWQTWWFTTIIVIIISILVYYVSLWFWKKQSREVQLNKKIIENELKALRAQINPHFLFNSLNSIQEFILYNQPEEASSYLNKFSMLMRMIIEYSKQNLITLEDENKFLTLYLQLEQLRFNNSFDFKITNVIPTKTSLLRIPPMVLQPIVENAIKHGMAGKKQGGLITIEYSVTETNRLCCKICDNGLGRDNNHMPTAEKTHKSVGLKNIEDRLKLLGDKTESGRITITDLFNEAGPCGTCVEVTFPNIINN